MSSFHTAEAVQDLVEAGIRAGAFPGAVAVWKLGDAAVEAAWAGAARFLPRAVPTGPEIFYDLASLTKPLVTATLAILARRDGLLDLSTRVGEVLDEATTRPVGAATVRHLLTHTSGLPAWAPIYCLAHGNVSEVEQALLDLPLEAEPGSRVLYSCPGFILLGRLLERRLGGRLADLLATRLLEPLGLTNVLGATPKSVRTAGGANIPSVERALLDDLGLAAAMPPASALRLPDDGNARFLGGLAGNAGLWGTAFGLLELALQHLPGSGSLLTEDELDLMAEPATPGGDQTRGLGWQLATSPGCSAGPSLSPRSIGHTGFTGCSLWIDREREAILLLLANRHHPGHRGVDLHPLRRRYHSIVLG